MKRSMKKWVWILVGAFMFSGGGASLASRHVHEEGVFRSDGKDYDYRAIETFGTWVVVESTDVMGQQVFVAMSEATAPLREMSSPYEDVKAYVGYVCEDSIEGILMVSFDSRSEINLDTRGGEKLADPFIGGVEIETRVKYNNRIETVSILYKEGGLFLHLAPDQTDNVIQNDTMMLEVPWRGEGYIHFQFSLDGAAKAIHKVREVCGLEHG